MQGLGWECPDLIIVTGDAYVDHSTFGSAIISPRFGGKGFGWPFLHSQIGGPKRILPGLASHG